VAAISNTPALTLTKPMNSASIRARLAGFRTLHSAALLLISTTLAIGAFLSFPLYDDGWMALMIRESGPRSLAYTMGDRPVFGVLLGWLVGHGSSDKAFFVVVNIVLWLALAIEAGILFRKIFPELKDYSIVAACVTLAPIVVQTQLTTILTSVPTNLPCILSFAAILILLRDRHADKPVSPPLLGVAAVLAMCGAAISEYGVAANLVGFILLIGVALTRRADAVRRQLFISATWLLALTGATYFAFTKMADFSLRPDVAPTHVLESGLAHAMRLPFSVIEGAWRALVTAYAEALSGITLSWGSKSTMIGVLFGLLTASLLWFGLPDRRAIPAQERLERFTSRIAILILSVLVGLLPVVLMGRPTTASEFDSRYLIPILPIAVVLTVAMALKVVGGAQRWIVVATFGMLIGYTTWTFTYTMIQQHRSIAAIQAALKPYVAGTDGYTAVIVPFTRFARELTPTVSLSWPLELEKKLWVMGQASAQIQFGPRTACNPDVMLDIRIRGFTRSGKPDQLLWVENEQGKAVSIEPYCLVTK
jgi:hypothetical protein